MFDKLQNHYLKTMSILKNGRLSKRRKICCLVEEEGVGKREFLQDKEKATKRTHEEKTFT